MDSSERSSPTPSKENESLNSDPDHRAIIASRNRLIALAVTGLTGMVYCGGRTPMDPLGTGGMIATSSAGSGGSETVSPEGSGGAAGQSSGGARGSDAAVLADARGDLGDDSEDADALVSAGCGCQASAGCTCT